MSLHGELSLPIGGDWVDKSTDNAIVLCKLQHDSDMQRMYTTLTVSASSDFMWHVSVNSKNVNTAHCCALQSLPRKLSGSFSLNSLIRAVDALQVCAGTQSTTCWRWQIVERGSFHLKMVQQ